jgi:phosphoglycerol transferase MdoB-like AlkP superfamily enzyme
MKIYSPLRTRLSDSRMKPVLVLIAIIVAVSFVTRLALLIKAAPAFEWSFVNLVSGFLIGLMYDLAMSSFFVLPFVLLLWFQNDKIYSGKWKWVTVAFYIVLLSLLLFTDIFPSDFNGSLYQAIIAYVIFRFAVFLLLLFTKKPVRIVWRKAILYFLFFLAIFILCFNAVSEYFFWDEFTSRYNFIAVDYLVYTNEVIGNIKESYPIAWIVLVVALIALAIFFVAKRSLDTAVTGQNRFKKRSVNGMLFIALAFVVFFFVNSNWKNFSNNEVANEIAGNGIYDFFKAFRNNELDFYKFFQTIPDKEAFTILRKELQEPYSKFTSDDVFNIDREIAYPEGEKQYNVVMISVESLSADFLQHFGSQKNITPYLDSLIPHSLFFQNLYSSGTRTVRGLEALSLSIPPTPGQSLVKRPGNHNLFTLGSVFRSKGYTSQYIYGGYSYFDNMQQFFGDNGYEVIDRSAIPSKDIQYQNIWGVCDEDAFKMALGKLDADHATGKPFFAQVMTVSNHRPYTYPENKIDIPPGTQSREGAVKYTDYSINYFLQQARSKPWFNNTIFVIVADHCAAVAGNVSLPVPSYHIPMWIYAPGIIQPRIEERLTAQIDIAPTILGLLNMRYTSKFFGKDVLHSAAGNETAFISTYQGLGMLTKEQLVVQMPPKGLKVFAPDFKNGFSKEITANDSVTKKAIAYYQCASWLIRNGKYNAIP